MWERFELFWTAFEKFALFFSFIASMTALVLLVLVYTTISGLQPEAVPALQPQDIKPLVDVTSKGFEQIDNAVLKTHISVNQTVPVTVDFRIDKDTDLRLVGAHRLTTRAVTLDLGGDAGVLLAERGTIELPDRSSVKVRMNVGDSAVVAVPIQIEIPIEIPLSSLNLSDVVVEMQKANAKIQSAGEANPSPEEGGEVQQ